MGVYIKKTQEERDAKKISKEVFANEMLETISEEYLDYTLPELMLELQGIVDDSLPEIKIRIKVLKEKIKDARIDFEQDE